MAFKKTDIVYSVSLDVRPVPILAQFSISIPP